MRFVWSGSGRRPKYCKPSHRQRAFEYRRYQRDAISAAFAADIRAGKKRRAQAELKDVLALGFEAMRAELNELQGKISRLMWEIESAVLKRKLLKKQLKNAPKPHAQLAREMRRAVDDVLGGAKL